MKLKPVPATAGPRLLLGLFSRRTRWGLTWRGRGAVFLFLLGLGAVAILRSHHFLAVSAPLATRVMVVEGWIPEPLLRAAAEQFRAGGYEKLCTVGGSVPEGEGTSGQNFAGITARQFYEMGIPRERVFIVPAGKTQRDRTYTSAAALREAFDKEGIVVGSFNVVTKGVHARRSRLMFEAAFGDAAAVGIISLPDPEYDAAHWWRYSEGVKEVMSEGAAYFYARFLFRAGD